jgi:excisionase family DNA binding protein
MRLLRTQEVAERLGLHPASVRRLAAQGEIPYVQAGGWRLFEARAVEALRRKRAERSAKRGGPGAHPPEDVGGDERPEACPEITAI